MQAEKQLTMMQSLIGHIFDYTAVIFSRDSYTTIRQGAGEKGREAAKLLFQALEEKEEKKVEIRIPVRLMERETVKELYV